MFLGIDVSVEMVSVGSYGKVGGRGKDWGEAGGLKDMEWWQWVVGGGCRWAWAWEAFTSAGVGNGGAQPQLNWTGAAKNGKSWVWR